MSWLYWGDELNQVLANQRTIIGMLQRILKEERAMAIDLTGLTAKVAKVQGAEDSAVALLEGLTAYIKSIPPSNDPATQAALDDLASKLDVGADGLSAAVVANPVPTP